MSEIDENDEWSQSLFYRPRAEIRSVTGRLEAAGLSAQDVTKFLKVMVNSLTYGELAPADELSPLREVLLLNELSSYLGYAHERVAVLRGEMLGSMLENRTLAQVADDIGISRQAVHKAVSRERRGERYANKVSMNKRGSDGR